MGKLFIKGVKTMKKGLILLVLLSLAISLPATAQVRFKDMGNDHWAADSVYDLVRRGVTSGFPDGTFRGEEKLSRYQTAVFLSKMAKSIENKGVSEVQVERIVNRVLARKGAPSGGGDVSGTLFISYTKGLSNSTIVNNFDINRAYLKIKKQLGTNAKAKVVLDSLRTGSTGMLETFVKYAYVDLQDTLPENMVPGGNMDLRIGLQPTFWSSWVDGILGLRVVASSMVGLDGGITTSDFGVGALGTVGVAGLPKINYLFTALNGSSVAAAETNAAKNIAFRFDSEVVPNIIVGGGGQVANVESDGDYGSKVLTGLVAYKTEPTKAYAELAYGMGALGISVSASQALTEKIGVFCRADVWDPNRTVSDDQTTRLWAGVTKDWNKNVKLVADVSSMSIGTGDASTQIALRTQVNL
jgi:hypothetical protein